MRILMTADTVGGVWTYALALAAALAPRGGLVHLATMGRPPDEEQLADARRARVAEVIPSTYRLEWEDDPWDDVARAGEWLLELEDELAPDLVHLNGFAHASLAWRSSTVVVAHSDVVSWWWAVHGSDPPARFDRYRTAVEEGLAAADVVVAPTRAYLSDLERHFRFESDRRVIHNGLPARRASQPKEPFVLGVGRFWDEAKNVAALEAVRSRLHWPVVSVGAGTERGRVSAGVAAGLFNRAAVFASPARYEPFGLSALEAAQAGCALVLGDLPSLREVWGDAALFADPDDQDALFTALDRVIRDARLRNELGELALRRAGRYSAARLAADYSSLYGQVAQRVAG